MPDAMIERIKTAVREETVRQYRDNDREKCPAGAAYYEEEIAPYQIARAVLAAMRDFPDQLGNDLPAGYTPGSHSARQIWGSVIDAALAEGA